MPIASKPSAMSLNSGAEPDMKRTQLAAEERADLLEDEPIGRPCSGGPAAAFGSFCGSMRDGICRDERRAEMPAAFNPPPFAPCSVEPPSRAPSRRCRGTAHTKARAA